MSTKRRPIPWHLIFLVLGAFIGPGSVLLSGRDRWDGVIGDYLVQSNRLDGLGDWLQDSGWWLLWGLMRGLAWLVQHAGVDYLVTLKFVIAAIMGWIAWETFRLAKDVFRLNEVQACWAAALTLVFPGYVLFHASCHVGVGLFLVFALLGYRLTLEAGPWRMALALVLIGLSFQMNSNLALVPALELARCVVAGRVDRRDKTRLWGLLLVSVVGYLFWKLVVGTGGVYSEAGYNRIVWPTDLASIRKLIIATVLWGSWLPLLLVGPAVWLAIDLLSRGQASPAQPGQAMVMARRQLISGLLLCGAAVVAYIAAGKSVPFFAPTFFGTGGSVYATFAMEFRPGNFFSGLVSPQIRHTILLGPMLSITMVAACMYAAGRFPSARIAPAAALSLMLGVTWAHQSGWALWTHHEKLVQGALDQSVVNALKKLPAPPDGASVLIERRQQGLQKDWTGTLETGFMLYQAYGRAAWIADTVFAPSGPSHDIALALLEENKVGFVRWAPKKDIRIFHIAGDFTDSRCTAGYVFDLAKPDAADLFWRMPFAPESMTPATLVSSSSQCPKV